MLQYILKRSNANIPAVKNQTLPINETFMCVYVCVVCMRVVLVRITKKYKFVSQENIFICMKKSDVTII